MVTAAGDHQGWIQRLPSVLCNRPLPPAMIFFFSSHCSFPLCEIRFFCRVDCFALQYRVAVVKARGQSVALRQRLSDSLREIHVLQQARDRAIERANEVRFKQTV